MPSSLRPPRESTARLRAAPEEVSILVWPLRDQPVESLVMIGLTFGLGWLAFWATQMWAVGLIVGAILTLTLWRTWLPIRLQIGAGGVVMAVFGWRRHFGWTAIQRYEIRGDGIWLFTDAVAAPLEELRSFHLPWGRHRQAVLALIEHYLPGLSGVRRLPPTGQNADLAD